MSDLLNTVDLSKVKANISLSTEHCLSYVKKECVAGDQIIFTVNQFQRNILMPNISVSHY